MKYFFTIATLFLFSISAFSQGSCDDNDLEYLGANNELVQQIATDCGTTCIFETDVYACMIECMGAQTPLTNPCIDCFSDQANCIIDNCFFPCALGLGDCNACVEENCLMPWMECAGIEDLDGDTFTNTTDCDDTDPTINPEATEIWYDGIDQNCDGLSDYDQDMDGEDSFEFGGLDCNDLDPLVVTGAQTWYIDGDLDGFGTDASAMLSCAQPPNGVLLGGDCDDTRDDVYPGAPGTGENIDNNCNGDIAGQEVACVGDFNGDLVVDTADLLGLLADFGCTENCEKDLTGDGGINTADMLAFLAQFGNVCL